MNKPEQINDITNTNVHNRTSKLRYVVCAAIFLILGLVIGTLYGKQLVTLTNVAGPVEIRAYGEYKHINPLLECDLGSISNDRNFNELRDSIQSYIDKSISTNKISFGAVYYRDLNNGPWFGINSNEKFSPASLIKVPVMMTYFRLADNDPTILTKEVVVDKDYDYKSIQNVQPSVPLVKGNKYTIMDLINHMIIYSDNYAYDLLVQNVDSNEIFKTFDDLGLPIRNANANDPDGDIITVKDYASFFRVLFNSSYLDKKYSELALATMTKTEYHDGIVNGLPGNVEVAHKFGERSYDATGEIQLHDCGIVYNSKKPYLICVMTRGSNIKNLSSTISDISAEIYHEVTSSISK